VGFIIITSILNVVGIKAAANATMLIMIFQILVLAIFVALSLRQVFHTGGAGVFVSSTPFLGFLTCRWSTAT
jgi:putrescine importer